MRLRALFGLLCLACFGPALAATDHGGKTIARIGQVVVEIPAGFSGPRREFPTVQSEIQNYYEVVQQGRAPTFVQLVHISIPHAASNLDEQTRYSAASDFLDGFMGTFGQKVHEWSHSSNERFRLGGYLGARARWTGKLNGTPATGVMYLVVLGRDSYSFHVFGGSGEPNASLKASVRAIEELRFEKVNVTIRPGHPTGKGEHS